jgi:hypothetical protein
VYAERLERLYAVAQERSLAAQAERNAHSEVRAAKSPSGLAAAIGGHLRDEHDLSSIVHWGNDGFTVDAALIHPERPDDVSIGVLCDGTRFTKAADRVQWDIFRAEVLEGQRWRLHRLWSPQFFRDPKGAIAKLRKAEEEWLAEEAAANQAALAAKQATVQEKAVEQRLLN